jgi:hypothetical protein
VYDAAEAGSIAPDYDDTLADEDAAEETLEMAPPTEERPLHEEQWFFTRLDRPQVPAPMQITPTLLTWSRPLNPRLSHARYSRCPHVQHLLTLPPPSYVPQAEQLLIGEGDFLVRESMTEMGQYILTVLQDGYPKHLLLVDPQGRVRTATQQFSSPSHLINYHFKSRAPIQSRGTRVHLGNPVSNSAEAPQFVDGVLYGDD